MIISHRHEFIYLKARKVAGTSVEVALAKHCGDDDIVTPVAGFNPRWDEAEYDHPGRTQRGYRRHSPLVTVRRRVGRMLWHTYFKFAVVRNPWDLVVSQYHWATRNDPYEGAVRKSLGPFLKKPLRVAENFRWLGRSLARSFVKMDVVTFEFFVKHLLHFYPPNDRFYFDRSGSVGLDFLMRYENLQDDYTSACARIGIPPSPLLSLKTGSRSEGRHYATYYDDHTRALVGKAYRRHINQFGYHFEGP